MDVRDAARRTLEAGSARVWMRGFLDPRPDRSIVRAFLMTVEGVVDLTRRRARLQTLDNPDMDALADRVASRWPWLDEGDDDCDTDAPPVEYVTVVIGHRRYVGRNGRFTLMSEEAAHDNPTWVLDHLDGGATRVDSEDVRGTACERFTLEPGGLRGDVWMDADGLLRRITWTEPLRGRRRLHTKQPAARLWHTVELWDFGLPVTIEVPDAQPKPEPGPLVRDVWEIGTELWRKRAAYRRAR